MFHIAKVLGKITLQVEYEKAKETVDAVVIQGAKRCILSFTTMVNLNILPKEWPNKILESAAISLKKESMQEITFPTEIQNTRLKERLFQDFNKVFPMDESKDPLRPMKGPEMRIELVPDAKPFKRFKANTIPFHSIICDICAAISSCFRFHPPFLSLPAPPCSALCP
jgi:hypothetical protein